MRFYDLNIGGGIPVRYSSHVGGSPGGKPDPGALRLELDVTIAGLGVPAGKQANWVRVWGIGITQISQASQFVGAPVDLSLGVAAGLPLATAAATGHPPGLVLRGSIFQAYGNWIGTAQTLDLILIPSKTTDPAATQVDVLNLYLDWKQGQPLEAALRTCLQAAVPSASVTIDIAPNLVPAIYFGGPFTSLFSLATYVKDVTKNILGGEYQGVDIVFDNNIFRVTDGTVKGQRTDDTTPKEINFFELIGQPTWIDFPQIQISVMMRSDIVVADLITLPPGQFTSSSDPRYSSIRQKTSQQGTFTVRAVRHVGNSRAPGAGNWITVITATPNTFEPAQ